MNDVCAVEKSSSLLWEYRSALEVIAGPTIISPSRYSSILLFASMPSTVLSNFPTLVAQASFPDYHCSTFSMVPVFCGNRHRSSSKSDCSLQGPRLVFEFPRLGVGKRRLTTLELPVREYGARSDAREIFVKSSPDGERRDWYS